MDKKLALASAKLEAALLGLTQVRLVDVGQDRGTRSLFFRIHLAPGTDPESLGIPSQVDGVPVRVVFADYHLD